MDPAVSTGIFIELPTPPDYSVQGDPALVPYSLQDDPVTADYSLQGDPAVPPYAIPGPPAVPPYAPQSDRDGALYSLQSRTR